jgi:hypothetical protein
MSKKLDDLDAAENQRSWLVIGALLAVVVVAGAWLRLLGCNAPLWVDELHTAWILSGPWDEIAPRAMIGNQSPAAYWVLWPYAQLVGIHDWSLRLPSIVASIGSLGLVFWLTLRWTGSAAGALVAATALTFEFQSMVVYGSEARVYAVVQFLALAQLIVFETLLRTGALKWRIASLLLAWLLFYLHYTTALLFVAEGIAWLILICLRKPVAYAPLSALADAGLFVVGCLPMLPHLAQIASRRGNWAAFIEIPSVVSLWDTLPHHVMLVAILAVWGGMLIWREQTHCDDKLRKPRPQVIALALCWLLVPLVIAWSLNRFDIVRLFFPRYLVVIYPAMGVVLALFVAAIPERHIRVTFAAIAALLLSTWTPARDYLAYGTVIPLRDEHWPQAIALLNEHEWQPNEPLLFASGLIEAEALKTDEENAALRDYSCYPLYSAYPLRLDPQQVEPLTFDKPGQLSARQKTLVNDWLASHDELWMVVRGAQGQAKKAAADVVESVPALKPAEMHGFGLVWVIEFKTRN